MRKTPHRNVSRLRESSAATPATPHFRDDDARWAAVVARDSAADGVFVFAVRSTGVFCRPSCASRAPRRPNVSFFVSPAAAQRAGFRACKRCRPLDAATQDVRAARMYAACDWLLNNGSEPTLAELAHRAGLSPGHFQRTFKAVIGLTPKQFVRRRRLARLCSALPASSSVAAAAYAAGYRSLSRVYADTRENLGLRPAAYRHGGAGEVVDFATRSTRFGWFLVAGAARGVAQIALGDSRQAVCNELRRCFPRATLRRETRRAKAWARAIAVHLAEPARGLPLRLDLQGTEFQMRVWAALQRIPAGNTMKYGELAAALGMSRAARAVARACAANRIALAVPCHRVVPRNRGGGGYRWGVARKAQLLKAERGGR